MPIPQQFPATGVDMSVSITRSVTLHRIGLELRFDGRLDADRLRQAALLSLDAEPTLGCSFDTSGFKPAWVRLPHFDDASVFAVVDSTNPDADMVAFQAEEVPDAGPQAKVLLLRAADGDVLGIKVSHILADGQAAKQYAYLLASLYSALGADPSYAPPANLTPRPTGADLWNALTEDQRRSAKKAASWTSPTWKTSFESPTGSRVRYLHRSLPPEVFRQVKEHGQQLGCTVNDMVLTAAFRACVDAFDPEVGVKHSLMCTADLRRYLPDPESLPISNISISGSLDIERVADESFDETLLRVHERMAAWANTCYGAAPVSQTEKMLRLGYRANKAFMGAVLGMAAKSDKTYPFFTNIGILDDSRLAFGDLKPERAWMFGPATPGPGIVFCVSTYRDELSITMGFMAEDADATRIEGVLENTMAELKGLQPTRS